MLIACPHCGERPSDEFSTLGDASLRRPGADASEDAWYDYVYLRDNPKGRFLEYWHHGGGCRAWLMVERDTQTHEVYSVRTAREYAGGAQS